MDEREANLRKWLNQLVSEVLGEDYYNEGADIYTVDKYTCRDLNKKFRKLRDERSDYFAGFMVMICVAMLSVAAVVWVKFMN